MQKQGEGGAGEERALRLPCAQLAGMWTCRCYTSSAQRASTRKHSKHTQARAAGACWSRPEPLNLGNCRLTWRPGKNNSAQTRGRDVKVSAACRRADSPGPCQLVRLGGLFLFDRPTVAPRRAGGLLFAGTVHAGPDSSSGAGRDLSILQGRMNPLTSPRVQVA